MVAIGGAAALIIGLLFWEGVYSSFVKLDRRMEHSTITKPSRESPAVHFEDFVPKKCGSEPTKDGFVKWNVLIRTGRISRRCVGTLISRSFVLTSAKCVNRIDKEKYV